MDNAWEAIFVHASATPDHPYLDNVEKIVHILGVPYNCVKDRAALETHIRSLFWSTYRRGFSPIAPRNGPTSDAGWGCMHRCGQMLLAEAITRVNLGGSAWRWAPDCQNQTYQDLRRIFQDTKSALYSIHNITMLGMALDKPIGSWFGPNTVAQVLKKLSVYDPSNDWYIHICVEDGIIMDEVKNRCHKVSAPTNDRSVRLSGLPKIDGMEDEWNLEAIKALLSEEPELLDPPPHTLHGPVVRDTDEDFLEIVLPPTFESEREVVGVNLQNTEPSCPGEPQCALNVCRPGSPLLADRTHSPLPPPHPNSSSSSHSWRPLLLLIPLRLGLQQPNSCYFKSIQAVFRIPQCVGIMGGRPSHAVWMVGVIGDDLICLDPHTTQQASKGDLTPEDDLTHHCDQAVRMPLTRLDPSMVIGFVCTTEWEFDDLCFQLEQNIVLNAEGGHCLFELHRTRPSNLPPFLLSTRQQVCSIDSTSKSTENNKMNSVDENWGTPDPSSTTMTEQLSKWIRSAGNTVRSFAGKSEPTGNSGGEFEWMSCVEN